MVGEIEEPGFLEGGDYFAAGEDLALVGIGLRSNIEACEQLMNRDWLGTDRLAVVRDDFEQHQVIRCNTLYSHAKAVIGACSTGQADWQAQSACHFCMSLPFESQMLYQL